MLCQALRSSSKSPAKASIADSRIQKDLHELATQRWTANCSVRITFPSTPNTAVAGAGGAGGPHGAPHLHVLITPTTGVYALSSFLFSIHLPSSYPFSPPHVRCLTPCLHPLLSFRTGRVHHPILHHDWKPVLSLNTIVFALQLLFHLHDSQPLTDGDEEVRRLMEGGFVGGGLFDVLVQQTLDGGFYFGMHWERNREKTVAEEQRAAIGEQRELEERKEYSPQQKPRQRPKREGQGGVDVLEEADDTDEDAKKRPRKIRDGHSAANDERETEAGDEEEDDRHRKHKQPHRHFLHRQTSLSPTPPQLHTVHRVRRGQREERKEGDDDASMTRTDSFSFRALQSSLPGPHSPPPLPHSVTITSLPLSPSSSSSISRSSYSTAPSIYSLSSPTSSSRLFALSSSSSSSSPALGSLAAMQRQHAMRTTLGVGRLQPGGARAATSSESNSVVRTLSSVMAD